MAETMERAKKPAGKRPGRDALDRLGLITEQDVADMRGISLERLRNERVAGGPPFVKWGQATFYRTEALRAWLAEQERSGRRDRPAAAVRSA